MNYIIVLVAITSPVWMMYIFIKIDNYLEKKKTKTA